MLEVGQNLDHFKILKLLGEGGMGMVYLAEDTKLNRKVALKVLLSETFDNPEHQNRFYREAKTAAQITHGNVMGIYDINNIIDKETKKEIWYIVMEYVQGLPLNQYVANTNLDLSDTIRLAEKISSGLSAAHRLNIVHRDIKAENIIVDELREPKILDFGLAKPISSTIQYDDESTKSIETEITRAGKIIGTVSYMSPEQARGEAVDNRSDIFSFGILLYRLVTGELPFSGPTQVSTLAKILETKHESPRKVNDNIPAELERIIDKCLQKKPDDRYQDTRDLVVDLRNLRKQYDSGMSESLTMEYDNLRSKKTNYLMKLSGNKSILYLVIAIFAVIIIWKYSGDTSSFKSSSVVAQENALAILGFENKTGDDELNWLETGLPEILLTDLSQSKQARIISRERVIDCLPPDKRISHTFEECVDAAGDLGAVNLLSGSFYKLGDKIRIDARLEEIATGKILVALKVVGDDPFKLVDSLTQKISTTLNFTETIGTDLDVATFVSNSPEAYKLYMQGLDYSQLELYKQAIDEFNKAIDLDSSFALAYMRIGLANIFMGNQQEGARYISLAKNMESSLPQKEKMLLDVYSDLWLEQQYDKAFIKMESYVKSYSNDKEAHTIYGLLINVFENDTTKAFAHIDTALSIDPYYQLALSIYAQIYREYGNLDKAIEFNKKIKEYHPSSPEPYLNLGRLYTRQMKYSLAIEELNEVLKRDPGNANALDELSSLYLYIGDIEKAEEFVEKMKPKDNSNPSSMYEYYSNKSNISIWKAKFNDALRFKLEGVNVLKSTNDSLLIYQLLYSIGVHYERIDDKINAMKYYSESTDYARNFDLINFPLKGVTLDPENKTIYAEQFKKYLNEFRKRLPSELLSLSEVINEMFEASINNDTVLLISSHEKLFSMPMGKGNPNKFNLGKIYFTNGDYSNAEKYLLPLVEGEDQTINGYYRIMTYYYLGRISEENGNNEKANKYYLQFLKYWRNADIQLDEILDAKSRIKSMTS